MDLLLDVVQWRASESIAKATRMSCEVTSQLIAFTVVTGAGRLSTADAYCLYLSC